LSAAKAASVGIDFHQGDAQAVDTARQGEAGATDARAKIDGMLAIFCRRRRRQQDGIMPDAMAFARLTQAQATVEHRILGNSGVTQHRALAGVRTQFVAKPCVLQQAARSGHAVFGDQHTARQYPERALEHAHVLIQNHVRDLCAVEQGANGRDENHVVGTNNLAHVVLPQALRRSSPGARCDR
jgi:hypothetical protein